MSCWNKQCYVQETQVLLITFIEFLESSRAVILLYEGGGEGGGGLLESYTLSAIVAGGLKSGAMI